jgi:hypothetical protein
MRKLHVVILFHSDYPGESIRSVIETFSVYLTEDEAKVLRSELNVSFEEYNDGNDNDYEVEVYELEPTTITDVHSSIQKLVEDDVLISCVEEDEEEDEEDEES